MKFHVENCLLYAVTDRTWLRGQTLEEQVEAALRGGVTMVQLREKDLDQEAFEEEARRILALCRRYHVPLLINDNVPLAARVGADGVHVGQNDMSPAEARAILGSSAIVGVTARTVEQALAAEKAGADYLGSGAVFGTSTKKDAKPMDPAYFRQICESVSIPVVAIGGITADNIRRLQGCKMSGFAIVSGIFAAEDIEARSRLLRQAAQDLCLPDYVEKMRASIESVRPVVQCITNIVTVNDCANALLAVGASPTMAHHPDEMEEFAAVSEALVCNMGATESLDAMMRAAKAGTKAGAETLVKTVAETAAETDAENDAEHCSVPVEKRTAGRPIVIDPVGCASSAFRREQCLKLIRQAGPACIRGNAAEIRALATGHDTGRGVDDREKSSLSGFDGSEAVQYAVRLARQTGAIVVASGATDYVTDGDRVYTLQGGSRWMSRVTGTGCMLSSLLGAFMAVDRSPMSAAACCAMMNACAEKAAEETAECRGGLGTFHVRLLDALSGPVEL